MAVATQHAHSHRRHNSSWSSFGSFGSEFDLSDVSGYLEANEFVLDNNFVPGCEDLISTQNLSQPQQPLRGRLGSGASCKLENMERIAENKEILSAIRITTLPRIPPPLNRPFPRSSEGYKEVNNASSQECSKRDCCADSYNSATSVKKYKINNAVFSQIHSRDKKDDEITDM